MTNSTLLEELAVLIDRTLYEQARASSQLLAYCGGKPDTILDEQLRHAMTVILWHLGEVKGFCKLMNKKLAHELNKGGDDDK